MIQSVKDGLEGIEIGYFDTGQDFPYLSYYEYFNHPSEEARRYAFAAFVIQVGNWHSGCMMIEYKNDDFNRYIKMLITNKNSLKADFPNMYARLIYFLTNLKSRNLSQTWYPNHLDQTLDHQLSVEMLKPESYIIELFPMSMKGFLKEIRVKPFFKSDLD